LVAKRVWATDTDTALVADRVWAVDGRLRMLAAKHAAATSFVRSVNVIASGVLNGVWYPDNIKKDGPLPRSVLAYDDSLNNNRISVSTTSHSKNHVFIQNIVRYCKNRATLEERPISDKVVIRRIHGPKPEAARVFRPDSQHRRSGSLRTHTAG